MSDGVRVESRLNVIAGVAGSFFYGPPAFVVSLYSQGETTVTGGACSATVLLEKATAIVKVVARSEQMQ